MVAVSITRRDARRLAMLLGAAGHDWIDLGNKFDEASKTKDQNRETLMGLSVEGLELSTRATGALRSAAILTVGQLTELTPKQILGWPNTGRKTLREIQEMQRYLQQRCLD